MKIKRPWLRIIVSVIVGGCVAFAVYRVINVVQNTMGRSLLVGLNYIIFISTLCLPGPITAAVFTHVLTPKERLDGETRCRKCGYILKGLTEPRCSECGERI